ncbi:MAG: glutamyl-tRNA reductase [Bacteroidales bacterium]|jgi:glutamyl-tRNA reductase|nr:glutamyl-tRNA reductase [Bacteroidales bacterium]
MIGIIGISYKTSPIEIREQFSFSEGEITQFTRLLQIDESLHGVVVLSTCNRTEIYFRVEKCCAEKGFELILRNLEYFKNYKTDLRKYFYFKEGEEAVAHLFTVVSGIDSLVIGEDQIIGQAKDAFKYSIENNTIGTVLTRMFNKAFEAGKRVRTDTSINEGCASVSSAAVELCEKELKDYSNNKILLIGTGQTGELALQNFSKRGYKSIYITNRTYSKAVDSAKKYGATAFEIENLKHYLPKCDVILVATSSKTHLITKEMVQKSNLLRNDKQMYIDLSVPRNISADVVDVKNVTLHTVDDLQEIVSATSEKRKAAISDAMEIIQIVKQEYIDWLNSVDLTPVILKIKNNFHEINNTELEGFLKIKSVKDSGVVSDYGKHITDKYARLFIRNLRTVSQNGKKKEFVELVNELFELQKQ